jgi:VCBS repeat-containing protein
VPLDVLSNDRGGAAKALYSIDDGLTYNAVTSPSDLLLADALVGGKSAWEAVQSTVNNAAIVTDDVLRIDNGKIDLDISHSLLALTGTSNINALAAGDHIHDSFIYAIRLGNGTLSWATTTVDVYGQNDAASISGAAAGTLTEDDTTPVTGMLAVTDPDHGESHTQTATNAASIGGLGTYSVDADGHWSYTVNTALVQYLNLGESTTDSFVATSLDGTAYQTVTITITGDNEAPAVPWEPKPATEIVYGVSGGANILHVASDGSLTDTGIHLANGGQYAYATLIADVNGDGKQDVVVTGDNGYGHLYYNNGGGSFIDSGALFPGSFQTGVAAADIDNDHDLDLFFTNTTGASLLYRNDGASGFTQVFSYSDVGGSGFYQTTRTGIFGDLNGDGFVDLYIPRGREDDTIARSDKIFLNDGTGHFADSGLALPVGLTVGVALGDVNNDGALDIVRAPSGGGADGVLINDGSGHFSPVQASFGASGGSGVSLADIDGNGTLDAILTNSVAEGGLQWWSNDGTGHFTFGATIDAALPPAPLTLADFNGDGHVDIFYGGSEMRTLMNDGTGHFHEQVSSIAGVFNVDAGLLI